MSISSVIFLHDAFFFINIAEIIDFVARQYKLKASEQWTMVRTVIEQYQQQFPNLENYRHFDLFVPTIQVEKTDDTPFTRRCSITSSRSTQSVEEV